MGFVESRNWRRAALLLDLLDAGQELGEDVGVLRPDEPFIVGAEISQGIQYYQASRHLTDENDRGPDNSVFHIVGKPAWVRVYIHSGAFSAGETITGQMDIERRFPNSSVYEHLSRTGPVGPGVVTVERRPSYADERSTLASTLNFVLPAWMMIYILRLTITIWRSDDAAQSPVDSFTTGTGAVLVQTLKLRGVLIVYNGPPSLNPPAGTPNLQLPAPGLADLQSTAAWTLTTYPVQSTAVFSSAGSLTWNTPLTGPQFPPGGCSTQWIALNAAIAEVKTNDGNRNDVVYYGLLPSGTPIANVSGCESSGVSAGPNGAQITMAHEVGHGAGLRHAPCGNVGTSADPAYPAYEPYDPPGMPTASIGEYGLDINTGRIILPTAKDFMSYCGPNWISLYHWSRLINADKLSPHNAAVPTDDPRQLVDPFLWPWEYLPDPPPWERGPANVPVAATPLISIIGTVDAADEVEIVSVMRVTALPILTGTRTHLIAELVGAAGGIVARAPVVRLDSHGAACGCAGEPADEADGPYLFQALLDDVETGAALLIRRRRPATLAVAEGDEKPIWIREAPDRAPLVQRVTAEVDDHAVHLRWSTMPHHGERQVTHSVQVTKDEGKSWNSVAVRVVGEAVDVSLDGLPTGPLRFRVLAHDGFHTASAVSDPITIPARPPVVTILHPVDGQPVPGGGSNGLYGAVTSLRGILDDRATVEWRIDGEPVDRGLDVFVKTPSPGQHQVELVVEDQDGQVVRGVPLIVTDADPNVE